MAEKCLTGRLDFIMDSDKEMRRRWAKEQMVALEQEMRSLQDRIQQLQAFMTLLAKHPDRVIERAVWGMLPKTTLSRQHVKQMLKVYAGPAHPHAAQQPEPLSLAAERAS